MYEMAFVFYFPQLIGLAKSLIYRATFITVNGSHEILHLYFSKLLYSRQTLILSMIIYMQYII